MAYENIGNIGTSDPGTRIIKPEGLIKTPNLVMKLYTLLPKDITINLEVARGVVQTKINKGEIKPHLSGMGFTILSPGFLNSSVWGNEFLVVAQNKVYSFEKEDLSDAKNLNLNQKGAYCVFEGIIFYHEALCWLKYLKSRKTEEDKEEYFNSSLEKIIN